MGDIELAGKQTSVMERGTMSPTSVLAHVARIQEMMKSVLHEGEHYGTIPGTDKPTLLKAGAEKLSFTFRLLPKFRVTLRDLGNGHREYEMVCELWHESGVFAGEGVGICSTMESKYRYRNVSDYEDTGDLIPADAKDRKQEYRKQGFGMKKVNGQWAWVRYKDSVRSENPDIADTYNTVLKMAKKRALVDATITACAASDIFTQDMEEGHEEELKDVTPPKSEQREATSPEYREAYAAGKAAQDSGLFTDEEIKSMLARLSNKKNNKQGLKDLERDWRDEALFRANIGGKVPFGEEKAANE